MRFGEASADCEAAQLLEAPVVDRETGEHDAVPRAIEDGKAQVLEQAGRRQGARGSVVHVDRRWRRQAVLGQHKERPVGATPGVRKKQRVALRKSAVRDRELERRGKSASEYPAGDQGVPIV